MPAGGILINLILMLDLCRLKCLDQWGLVQCDGHNGVVAGGDNQQRRANLGNMRSRRSLDKDARILVRASETRLPVYLRFVCRGGSPSYIRREIRRPHDINCRFEPIWCFLNRQQSHQTAMAISHDCEATGINHGRRLDEEIRR